jgi:hypothetical protein
MKRRLAILATLAGLIPALLFSGIAAAAAPPDVYIYSAKIFRNVTTNDEILTDTEGDLLAVIRYELPWSTTGGVVDAWCLYVENNSGCDGSPAAPDYPDSILNSYAFATIYKSGFGTTLTDQAPIYRIGPGLAGIYIDSGHSISHGDVNIQVCIEASASQFSPVSLGAGIDCIYPDFSSGETQSENLDELTEYMTGDTSPLGILEQALGAPSGFFITTSGKITPNAVVYGSEVLHQLQSIIPDAYQIGAKRVLTDVSAPAGALAIQAQIDATAVASGFTANMNTVASTYAGITGTQLVTFLTLALGLVAAGVLYIYTRSGVFGAFGFLTVASLGMFVGGPSFAIIAGMITVMGTAGAWYVVRKTPE